MNYLRTRLMYVILQVRAVFTTYLTIGGCPWGYREKTSNECEVVEGGVIVDELKEEEFDNHGVFVKNVISVILQISEFECEVVVDEGQDLNLNHIDN